MPTADFMCLLVLTPIKTKRKHGLKTVEIHGKAKLA